jgi:sugar/nucleoside kinase (ribokinase family)
MIRQSGFDLITIGHFTIDTINLPHTKPVRTALGGPPTYVSIAAAKLGAKVSVISKVGDDFPTEYQERLQGSQVDLAGLKHVGQGVTTRFVLKYQTDYKRTLRLEARAPRILAEDINISIQPRAIHVAPVACEFSEDSVAKLRKATRTLSLDPQGFIRDFAVRGYMRLKPWAAGSVLDQIDIYKSSSEEIKMVVGTVDAKKGARKIQDYGVKIVVVTRGLQGSTLLIDGTFFDVPACESRGIVDPTGAGDTYIGAFLAEYTKGKDPLWCACVGSASASFVVENFGSERFGDRQETYERAEQIYEKGISN